MNLNKTILATAVATTMMAAGAGVTITGDYTGFITNDSSTTSYAQDLDLTLKGTLPENGTSVTATIENLGGTTDTLSVNELYVETNIEGLNVKLGKSKSILGAGIMQKKSAAVNQLEIGLDAAGYGVSINQVSGENKVTFDTTGSVGSVNFKAQNVTNSERYITVAATVAGVDLAAEYQKTAVGTNTGLAASTLVAGFGVTYAQVDVGDASGVTQDGSVTNERTSILEDISDAAVGEVVRGIVLSKGDVTGKAIKKNDKMTYVAMLNRGPMQYSYAKTEAADGVLGAKVSFNF
jgi:hypothetical protein